MYNPDTEILFPGKAIAGLSDLRGQAWEDLVNETKKCSSGSTAQTAFLLMMIKINGCISCNVDSFRAMRGCPACAQLNIRRYKGSDDDLVLLFHQAKKEVESHLAKKI